jgi:hypothetical protein
LIATLLNEWFPDLHQTSAKVQLNSRSGGYDSETRMQRRKVIMVLVVAFVWPIADARAHGHPVIEGLYNGNVYLPSPGPKPALSTALARSVESVYAHHLRIKVAVVGSPADLGVLSGLWEKPFRYTKHLATDLSALYVGPFLIVMPAGFAVYDGGRSVAAERRALKTVRLRHRDLNGLTRAANDAVQALLRARALRSKDIRSPFAYASPTTIHPGSVASLSFSIRDDSLWSRVSARVATDSGRVWVIRKTGLIRVSPTKPIIFHWSVPTTLPQQGVRVCVVAQDASGNRSKDSCSDLTVN